MLQLQVRNLSKKYIGKEVLGGLNFDYTEGVLGIAGSNGSGKSTLLKCLAFLLKPSSGEIIWKRDEKNLDREQVKNALGFAAPYIELYPELSTAENLEFLARISDSDWNKEQEASIVESTETTIFRDQSYGSLSSGQQQRVKLAASLIRNPDILILDEPGTNLDQSGHQIIARIAEERRKNGRCLIIASNSEQELQLCDQIITLGN